MWAEGTHFACLGLSLDGGDSEPTALDSCGWFELVLCPGGPCPSWAVGGLAVPLPTGERNGGFPVGSGYSVITSISPTWKLSSQFRQKFKRVSRYLLSPKAFGEAQRKDQSDPIPALGVWWREIKQEARKRGAACWREEGFAPGS